MQKRFFITLLLLCPILLWAQPEVKPASAGLAFGVLAHSFGFGFDVQYLVLRGDWDYSMSLSLSSYKNPKELKIESAYADQGGKDYVYDKQNYCYVIAPMFGLSRKLISRGIFNRVGLRGSLSAGPLLALLKPYYVDVAVPFNGNQAFVEPKRYDYTQYNYSNIYGVGDYFLGMDEMTVVPGARIKAATMVDLSSGTAYIRGVELGLFADIYAKKLPLLGFTSNRQTFVGGSIEILIGNTW